MWALFAAVAWATPTVELAYQGESLFRPGVRAGLTVPTEGEGLKLRPVLALGGWHQPAHSTLVSSGVHASLLYVLPGGALELSVGTELCAAIRAAPTYSVDGEELSRPVQLGALLRSAGGFHVQIGPVRPFVRQGVGFRGPSGALGSLHLVTEIGVGFTP